MTDSHPPTSPADPRAQDVFARMLREDVAPTLRTWGFRGSGQTFELRDEKYWAILGFQRSRHSRAEELEFTVNVAVAAKARWDELRGEVRGLGKRPAPSDFTHAGALRLDQIDPGAAETWWLVRPDTDTTATAADLLGVLAQVVLPWLHARVGRAAAPHTLTRDDSTDELLV